MRMPTTQLLVSRLRHTVLFYFSALVMTGALVVDILLCKDSPWAGYDPIWSGYAPIRIENFEFGFELNRSDKSRTRPLPEKSWPHPSIMTTRDKNNHNEMVFNYWLLTRWEISQRIPIFTLECFVSHTPFQKWKGIVGQCKAKRKMEYNGTCTMVDQVNDKLKKSYR